MRPRNPHDGGRRAFASGQTLQADFKLAEMTFSHRAGSDENNVYKSISGVLGKLAASRGLLGGGAEAGVLEAEAKSGFVTSLIPGVSKFRVELFGSCAV